MFILLNKVGYDQYIGLFNKEFGSNAITVTTITDFGHSNVWDPLNFYGSHANQLLNTSTIIIATTSNPNPLSLICWRIRSTNLIIKCIYITSIFK